MSNRSLDGVYRISVLVPENSFRPPELPEFQHCLCALDVLKLMEWWPGIPHQPERDMEKVRAIQRSLDWKRVAEIAAYLLQEEILYCGEKLDQVFGDIYEPKKNEPGREWPPKIRGAVKFNKSSFPYFSNVLIHVNGAKFKKSTEGKSNQLGSTAEVHLNPKNPSFSLSVIDGQHRINGAYFAIKLREETLPDVRYEIPAELFLNLDEEKRPKYQAQIFIDVNLYQKKVDRSLVADLFPLTRKKGDLLDRKGRAQDFGRKLMLEVGPLVGMIQIPGIRYGVKNVVTLATLNDAIERAIPHLENFEVSNLEGQTAFLAQVMDCWLAASGRAEQQGTELLDGQNVVYQGRVLVSIIHLVPALLWQLKIKKTPLISDAARSKITAWLKKTIERAGLTKNEQFIDKALFKERGFLGSGGIGRFRDLLWAAAFSEKSVARLAPETISDLATKVRVKVNTRIAGDADVS